MVKIQCTQIMELLEKLFSGESWTISFYVSFFFSFFLSVSKVTNVHCCVTKTVCCVTFSLVARGQKDLRYSKV